MTKHGVTMSVALSVALMGCGNADVIDRSMAQQQEFGAVACECPAVVGEPSEMACRASFAAAAMTESEEECWRGVYTARQAELEPYFECVLDATTDVVDCLRALVSTTCPPETSAIDGCNERFYDAAGACVRPSPDATTELNACLAPRG